MKRKIYIILVMFLLAVLGFFIYLLASLYAINRLGFDLFAFWPIAAVVVILLGIFGGLFLGKIWWKFVYIDRRMKKIKRNNSTHRS
jgi:hypothetical protein